MSSFELFVVYVFALWRVVSMVANEDGPFDLFRNLRGLVEALDNRFATLHDFGLYKGYTCEWCVSLWLGFPFACLIWGDNLLVFPITLAGSTGVIAIKYIVQVLQQVQHKLEKE